MSMTPDQIDGAFWNKETVIRVVAGRVVPACPNCGVAGLHGCNGRPDQRSLGDLIAISNARKALDSADEKQMRAALEALLGRRN
jgi:hypothetical protein